MESQNEMQYRSVALSEADTEKRTVTGLAVPFNREQDIFEGYFEQFAPGSIEVPSAGCKLLADHDRAIGTLTGKETNDGWEIEARVAKTSFGDDVLELARVGVYSGLSVGFQMLDFDDRQDKDGIHRTVKKALVREVSLTPFPAYEDATVTNVRQKGNMTVDTIEKTETEKPPAPPAPTTEDVNEIKSEMSDLKRSIDLLATGKPWETNTAKLADTRSVGTFLKSIMKDGNDADLKTLQAIQERAYDGGTTADTVMLPQWVGDLTRIIDQGAGISREFATGTLPNEGYTLEYAQLKTNTIQVTKQAKDRDPLATGNVSVETKNATVETFGGATSLSRQEIERGHVRILDHHMRAMAIAAGQRKRASFHAVFDATVAAQSAGGGKIASGKTLANLKYADWVGMIVDAAVMFENGIGLALEKLIVDTTVFKHLATMIAADGRPLLSVSGTGANTAGTMNVTGLTGNILNIPVKLDTDLTTATAVFANSLAIRSYESPLVRLQDESILNLTKDFSVYFYGAYAPEIPGALVPITGLAGTTTGA